MMSQDLVPPSQADNEEKLKKLCKKNFVKWRKKQNPLKFKTQVNENFDLMMNNVVKPFINTVIADQQK